MATVHETDLTDPDHHLWRNGRLWWVAFTVHLPGWQKERVRQSLGTADLAEARRRRDALLARYPQTRPCTLSLRIQPRRRMAVVGFRRPAEPDAGPMGATSRTELLRPQAP
ncbi:MAG: hypothetical protein NDJ94_06005 [Vicinamibacteria bacterium]|nr:hypothetical protein [Vicinamibacteria bacterium]